MAPIIEESAETAEQLAPPEYSILKQRVDLDIDFAGRSLKGNTEITVQPLTKDLKQIKLHCRQCKPTAVQAGGMRAKWTIGDPYQRARMPEKSDVHQHEILHGRVEKSLRPAPEPELTITLPPRMKIQELHVDPTTALPQYDVTPSLQTQETDALAIVETQTPTIATAQPQGPHFAPIKLLIEFEVTSFRDGIHWVGYAEGDRRYPYLYTKAQPWAGATSCIFPCVDDATSRCSWEVSVRCPRTLGDAFRVSTQELQSTNGHTGGTPNGDVEMAHASYTATNGVKADQPAEYSIDLSKEEAALPLAVLCVGDAVDDLVDSEDETRHIVTFSLTQAVTARHIGFAVGPFEHVDLSATRKSADDVGQNAVKLDAYCLPGKVQELRNTCYPIAWAMDHLTVKYGSFPFGSLQIVFVDDFIYDTVATAGLSFCSSQLLFPKPVIEPIYKNTRALVRSLTDQWIGISIIAKEPRDEWVVAGVSGFMTDLYMKELCGNNEYRWQQKLASEKIYDLDVDRPSLYELGKLLHLDHSIRDFVQTKSALVLFILEKRLLKNGSTGVHRAINKLFLNARGGTMINGEVTTADLQRTIEKFAQSKDNNLTSFFRQWVYMSGCPIFYVTQRFNRKKTCIEMMILQKQLERVTKPPFAPSNFMREIKEHMGDVWAPEPNPVFTGAMTIRVHEADGTPFDYVVQITEAMTKFEISYNTKYKRLKRSRRQKERQMAETTTAEDGNDTLLYCLGDTLDSEEEKREWDLVEWTAEDEEKMGQENYEWISMDADFEWIGRIHLVMPLYMYVSQLQQDRDVVAQLESLRYITKSGPHHVSLSIMVRTLMDSRYFWGIRETAAESIATLAEDRLCEVGELHLMKAFRALYCIGDTNMPKTNDFSNRRDYVIQCAIPKAMAKLRDPAGKTPMAIRQLFVDLLKFNDNSNNKVVDDVFDNLTYSDNHYVATLMNCLADSLVASHREPEATYTFNFGDDDEPMNLGDDAAAEFEKVALDQIERHRRIDEWDPSYQNIYTVTSLDCLRKLTKAGVVKDKSLELMKYVRAGNADNVRIAAWRCLSEIGVLRKMAALRFLLHSLADDPSPWFRDQLLQVFGEALGHIALGDPEPEKAPPQPAVEGGLVLEQEISSEARRLEAARKTTPEGALVALRSALVNEDAFSQALWYAATSPGITIEEIAEVTDIAALIFEPVNSFVLPLKMPRMWRCSNMGQGKVKFFPHGPHRNTPRKGLGLADWQNLQANGLKYEGPLSAEVIMKQKEAQQTEAEALKLQIAETEQQLSKAQTQPADEVRPTPVPVPSIEKQPTLKLSLGAKRKVSADVPPRDGSPKTQKVLKQQTPSGTLRAQTPQSKASAGSPRRSSTPGSRSGKGKGNTSGKVVLKLPNRVSKLKEILSQPSDPGRLPTPMQVAEHDAKQSSRSITPVIPQATSFTAPASIIQSPTGLSLYGSPYSADPPQMVNLGAFRTFEPAPLPDAEPITTADVKMESTESPIDVSGVAPFGESISNGTNGLSGAPIASPTAISPPVGIKQDVVEDKQEVQSMAPPPPRPKVTLKLGARKPSQQSTPTPE